MQVPAPAPLHSQRLIRQQLAHQRPDRLVENRHVFGSEHAELNIYETFEEAQQVALQFHHPVVIGMIEGKKVMHFFEQAPFGFYPNETLILPAGEAMHIDFPEATAAQPTRCLALLVSEELVRETLAQHAEALSRYRSENVEVCEELGNHSVLRNPHIAQNIDRIVQLFLEKDQQAARCL
ncbi:MAG: AraC family transcriptional regulator [Microscillaceae bacterium]|nr:AraC family transcriptional regulator [Microscillaceae bacterium]